MFWNAVGSGLAMLAHWQIWASSLSVAAVMLTFRLAMAARVSQMGRERAGCVTPVVGGLVLQGALTGLFLAFIFPLFFGAGTTLPATAIAGSIVHVLVAGVLGAFGACLIFLLPVIGGSIPIAVSTYVAGVITCRLLVGAHLESEAGPDRHIHYPGFFASIGFVAIAWALYWVAMLVITSFMSHGSHATDESPSLRAQPLLQSIGTLAGYLPVLMYVRYAVSQL